MRHWNSPGAGQRGLDPDRAMEFLVGVLDPVRVKIVVASSLRGMPVFCRLTEVSDQPPSSGPG
jgi:hypothetical protein